MTEEMNKRQLLLSEVESCIEQIRQSLFVQTPTPSLLVNLIQTVIVLKNTAVEVDSFHSIAARLEKMLLRHSTAQTVLSPIESEMLELALDWLTQLALLYSKDLPEPKSLIAELLYAFDLVEHSQEAVALSETVFEHGENGEIVDSDPFQEDPVLIVENCSPSGHQDPFADDPGFGLEFDLLRRTLNLAPGARKIVSDPFKDDPLVPEAIAETQPPLYDVFAGDPPLSDEPEDQN